MGFIYGIKLKFSRKSATLDIETVIDEAVATNFPISQLAFSLQQHVAPRVLQVRGCSSRPVQVNASILAGCKFSVPITRMYSLRSLKSLVAMHPRSNTEVFVDDTSMHCNGNSCDEVLDVHIPAMRAFKKRVRRLKQRLSSKAVIVSSSVKLNNLLAHELESNKLFFVKSKHARDLGISHSCGRKRPSHLLSERLKNLSIE